MTVWKFKDIHSRTASDYDSLEIQGYTLIRSCHPSNHNTAVNILNVQFQQECNNFQLKTGEGSEIVFLCIDPTSDCKLSSQGFQKTSKVKITLYYL